MSVKTSQSEIPAEYVSLLNARLPKLQMLPAVAVQALEVIKQPQCSVIEFSSIVERDATLASNMLRIANSPIYSPRRTISNLHQAVVRLGFQECKNLIMSSCVATLTKKLDFQEEWIRDVLWRHSLYTGTIAHHINRTFDCGYRGEEFTAGLLHDFGRVLFAVLFPDEFLAIDPLDFDERTNPETSEKTQLGMSHVEFAEHYGNLCNLPDDLIAVMRWHHAPEDSAVNSKLCALISIADDMANHLQRVGDSTDYDITSFPFLSTLVDTGLIRSLDRLFEFAQSIIDESADDMHSSNAL